MNGAKLPKFSFRLCLGIDIGGVREECTKRIQEGSMFPYCDEHLEKIRTMPRKRICAGAIVYDGAMREKRVECKNLTGHEEERLCAHCRVIEKRESERRKRELGSTCPHCGQKVRSSNTGPSHSKTATPKTHSTRAMDEPRRGFFGGPMNGSSSGRGRSWQGSPPYPHPKDGE